MGVVISFLERLRAARDWTATERARLEDLAIYVAAETEGGGKAAFGVSDQGDPWFVVKDAADEVIVHVARIGGKFVLHAFDMDQIQEGPDLMALLAATLGEAAVREVLEPPAAAVTAFGNREERSLFPALMAGALVYEAIQALPEAARRAFLLERELADVVVPGALQLGPASSAEALLLATRSAEPVDAPPAPAPAVEAAGEPAPEAPQDCAPVELAVIADHLIFAAPEETASAPAREAQAPVGGAGLVLIGGAEDDVLVGGAGADWLQGGEGDDVLDGAGAPDGQVDVLDGGAGDDVLVMGPNVVAIGGAGADQFLIAARPEFRPGHGPMPLGVILDFVESGDRLVFAAHLRAQVVSVRPEADVLADLRNFPGFDASRLSTTAAVSGERLGIDFDGDGQEDAYLMVGNSGRPLPPPPERPPGFPPDPVDMPPYWLLAYVLVVYGTEEGINLIGAAPGAHNDGG